MACLSCVLICRMTPIPKVGQQVMSKKAGSRALMGAMVRTLWGLLFLLLALARASEEGEICTVWLQGPISGLLLFRCPQRPDGTDGQFCCGTCLAPYCCDSEKARLDLAQPHCLHAWNMLTVFVGAAVDQKEKVGPPLWRDLETTSPTAHPQSSSVLLPVEIVLIVIASVLIFVLATTVCMWKYPQLCASCLGLPRGENDAPPEFPMMVPSSLWGSNRPLEVYDPPPPYEEIPPPYRPPSNRSRGEDGATGGPRRVAFNVRGSEEAATQAPMTSGTTSATGLTGVPAASGEVTPELGAADAGDMTPESRADTTGEETPELGAATGGEIASVQVAAGTWDAASRGEGTSSASGLISTQPVPVKMTIPHSSRVSWETDDSEV